MFSKKTIIVLFSVALAAAQISCSSFVKEEDMSVIKKLEARSYRAKKDIKLGSGSVKKGEEVKVVIMVGDDWIKVYTYPFKGEKLSSPRTLVLYLFEDGFKEEKYSYKVFEKRFFEILEPKTEK